MKVNIKTAESKDWKIIQKLNNQVFINDQEHDDDIDMDWPFSADGIKYYKKLADGKYGKCFIAYSHNQPVGYVAISIKDFGYRKSKYVEIENIGVDPEFRSQGIGKMLVEKATEWAKVIKATKLFVIAYWENTKAVNFYKKNGFYESGIELDKNI
jgi:ribosomal protein S18 acetylase RimI-like enzyme